MSEEEEGSKKQSASQPKPWQYHTFMLTDLQARFWYGHCIRFSSAIFEEGQDGGQLDVAVCIITAHTLFEVIRYWLLHTLSELFSDTKKGTRRVLC